MSTNPAGPSLWPCERPPPPARRGHPLGKVVGQALLPAIASAAFFVFHKAVPGWILAGVAVFVLASGLWVPAAFDALARVAALFGKGVGVGLTYLLLVPFYYLVFAPMRLLQRLTGKDPLNRAFPSGAPTYWIPRPPVTLDQYGKQH